jgi:hypothetical protein
MFIFPLPIDAAVDHDEPDKRLSNPYRSYYECWRCEYAWLNCGQDGEIMDCPQCGAGPISPWWSTLRTI